MKVLTIKQPYASLISSGKKKIETRSWKTNYRGELYIHAGMKIITKKDLQKPGLKDLIGNDDVEKYGKILCKCTLVDCIYMDDKYIENIKNNYPDQYICGRYEVGRYAWVLDNVEPLNEPIEAKGQLSIWNYKKTTD